MEAEVCCSSVGQILSLLFSDLLLFSLNSYNTIQTPHSAIRQQNQYCSWVRRNYYFLALHWLHQGLKHAAREGILCDPRWCLGIFK